MVQKGSGTSLSKYQKTKTNTEEDGKKPSFSVLKYAKWGKFVEKHVKLYKALLNIAKIIETQYEPGFIVPIIGEILDKFIEGHLVYIFIDGKLKWPKEYRDPKIGDLAANLTFEIQVTDEIGVFPLKNDEKVFGAIVTKSMDAGLTKPEIEQMKQLATQSSATVSRAYTYKKLFKDATLDSLTGLYNRGELDRRLKQEIAAARRQKTPLCTIMIDIDFFKQINDTHGHSAGDCVLKTVAGLIRSKLREYDIAGRYGGEEFVVILPSAKIEEAELAAERLRKAVEKKKIKMCDEELHATISLGVSEFNVANPLEDADKALYQAKTGGRNRSVVFERE